MNDAAIHKRWWKESTDNFAPLPRYKRSYFAREFAPLKLGPGSRILDVGFGDGELMNFARSAGYVVEGVEINEAQIAAARQAGFVVYADMPSERIYDVVCAFDVMEHIPAPELPAFLAKCRARLVDGGSFLIRVPNGHSPFGMIYQHGNITHVTPIGAMMIEQLASITGFEVVGIRDQALILHDNPIKALVKLMQWPIGKAVEILMAAAFFSKIMPMHPNLISHLRKS